MNLPQTETAEGTRDQAGRPILHRHIRLSKTCSEYLSEAKKTLEKMRGEKLTNSQVVERTCQTFLDRYGGY